LAESVVLRVTVIESKEEETTPVKTYVIKILALGLRGETSLPDDVKVEKKNWVWSGCSGGELGMVVALRLLEGSVFSENFT